MSFNSTAGAIDWKHHRHTQRSERIPVRADRIVNVNWSDSRQGERERGRERSSVGQDSFTHEDRERERESGGRRGVFHPRCRGSSCEEKAGSPGSSITERERRREAGQMERASNSNRERGRRCEE